MGWADRRRASRRRALRRERESPFTRAAAKFALDSLSGSKPPYETMLRRLNSLVILGSPGEAYGSPYRTTKVVVRWRGKVVYRAPEAEKVPHMMDDLVHSLSGRAQNDVDLCSWAYFQLMKIHPFKQGNGRTARTFASYLLLQRGWHARRGRSLERFIDSHLEEYYGALFRSKAASDGPWTEFFNRAIKSSFFSRSQSSWLSAASGHMNSSLRRLASAARRLVHALIHHDTRPWASSKQNPGLHVEA